jgi:hypothetical protein
MGLQNMLSVLFGLRAVGAVAEHREGEAVRKDLQAQLNYMSSPDGLNDAQARADRRILDARGQAAFVWHQAGPEDRLFPPYRVDESDGGVATGSRIDPAGIGLQMDIHRLYAVAYAGDDFDRYLKSLDELADDAREDFESYGAWLGELRAKYGTWVDEMFATFDQPTLCARQFFEVRKAFGYEPANVDYWAFQRAQEGR